VNILLNFSKKNTQRKPLSKMSKIETPNSQHQNNLDKNEEI
jgi:hypothetical protein